MQEWQQSIPIALKLLGWSSAYRLPKDLQIALINGVPQQLWMETQAIPYILFYFLPPT